MGYDIFGMFLVGEKSKQDLDRELAKHNYLNVRDRKSKKKRFK